ncbi:MAG: 3-isopropylmalate dehydratase small subunit [Elusimicrobia bacterium RIFCSPLOWO2_01_FULL_54_10]|nr:MAG: 3-isopropylmalate dehydratase small subunit [Elusimicrobia bacterium RIFCSPLOWO2_01_FULL_54_10]
MKINSVSGRGLPLPGNDIDTDRIIPARYLKCVTFDDLGQYAFYDVRFDENDKPKDHPFNDPRYKGASILIVGRNFGCGSSREHAPQSIKRFGINAIVGVSFAEIFADNCTAIGIPAVTAEQGDIDNLMNFVKDDPACDMTVDLNKNEVAYGDFQISIRLPEQSRSALVNGSWDSTAELLSAKDRIQETASKLPYNNNFS